MRLDFGGRYIAVLIPAFRLVEQMRKLLHDQLVYLLRGCAKDLFLLQQQLFLQPLVLQQRGRKFCAFAFQFCALTFQFCALTFQLLFLFCQFCLQRLIFRTGNRYHFRVACPAVICLFHAYIIT